MTTTTTRMKKMPATIGPMIQVDPADSGLTAVLSVVGVEEPVGICSAAVIRKVVDG